MFLCVDELEEGRVRATFGPKALLCNGEDPVPFPGMCGTADDACPELNSFQEEEWAKTIERHLFFWVLGFGALPALLHPFGSLRNVPQL